MDTIEDYQLLEVHMKNNSRFYVCKDIDIPIATRLIPYEDSMSERDYWANSDNRTASYMSSHIITFESKQYVIEEEITGIKYTDECIVLSVNGISHSYTAYIPYQEISFFTRNRVNIYDSTGTTLAEQYNKLLLELKGGELV